jgi:hypothetical protein
MSTTPARFTLYSGPLGMFWAMARIAALEKGLDFGLAMVRLVALRWLAGRP